MNDLGDNGHESTRETSREAFRVSVRDLVAAARSRGSLGHGYVSRQRAVQGIREHGRVTDTRPEGYKREVSVSVMVEAEHFDLKVFGRIDGVMHGDDTVILEEIKSCKCDPGERAAVPGELHLAQLKCYGHMYAQEHGLDELTLVLTYAHTLSDAVAEVKEIHTADALARFFHDISRVYLEKLTSRTTWKQIRNQSIQTMAFPYTDFRQGQRDLAEAVYRIIKNRKILFARAPTGTGKTIATLFPAVKSLGLNQVDKIFFLTAKTLGRTVAKKAVQDMAKEGLRLKTVFLTAKQKICFMSDESCDPDACPYAQSYYSKFGKVMAELSAHDLFDRSRIEEMGRRLEICPFELSLDLSLECDLIICDLNYAFDPRVYLKRFFENGTDSFAFLIDEAHNLPDRLRSMYASALNRSRLLEAQMLTQHAAHELSRDLAAAIRAMARTKAPHPGEFTDLPDPPEAFIEILDDFCARADQWLDSHPDSPIRREFMDYYFEAVNFVTIAHYFGDNYRFFMEVLEDDLQFRLFCIDPSPIFSKLIRRADAAVFFSATFFPKEYYREILFGPDIDPFAIVLPSPFPPDNLKVIIHQAVRTTYRERHRYYADIAQAIRTAYTARPGNTLVFFPSYAYMNRVADHLDELDPALPLHIQEPGMPESRRKAFLDRFTPEDPIIGFAVMGGIFGEGIDLAGDCLITVMVVGVGLPQICPEQDRIRAYYDEKSNTGFFNAYQMPGFNRVLQAAGRLIRTETDRGVVILLDQRFVRRDYQVLYPLEWQRPEIVNSKTKLKEKLETFWKD